MSDGLERGAELVVRLPAAAAPSPSRAGSGPNRPAPQGQRVRVLVVEDNADAAESLSMLLELAGHQVRLARDGLEALELARHEAPEVMLVDIGLPGMDGYEVARQARLHPALAEVSLVALTGYGRDEDRERARAAGFDDHLVKPVDIAELERLLGRVEVDRGRARHR
jgi:two-component system CheB/CheR fusion protein